MPVLVVFLAACTHGSDGVSYGEAGECAPPSDGSDLAASAVGLFNACELASAADLAIVQSDAEWSASFSCAQPVPQGIDLSAQRAAIVHVRCSPTEYRFASDRAGEVVIGVFTRGSGACIDDTIIVPLPRSTKPVRLARCQETCSGDCPTLP